MAEPPIIETCRFDSHPLTTSSSSRARMSTPGRSCRRMGMRHSGPADTRAALTLRKTSCAGTVSLWPTRRGRLLFFLSLPGRMKPTQRLTALGALMPITTSFTVWLRCVGGVLLGRFSASRLSTRTTCAATPTRTTRPCGTRSNPSGSANVERSRSLTARSASPTTGSKRHSTAAPRLAPRHAKFSPLSTYPTISHAIPYRHRSTTPQKPHDFNVPVSKSEILAGELHATFPVLHPIGSITPNQNGCNAH